MRDPEVTTLRYRLKAVDGVTYQSPPPITMERNEFLLRLEEGVLTCMPKIHFASVDQAKAAVQPIIRAWEIHSSLNPEREEVRFSFDSAEVVDRDPPAGTLRALEANLGGYVVRGASATMNVVRRAYPRPPEAFLVDPDVEVLWMGYRAWKEGREPLQAMAYFAITVLQVRYGGRAQVAREFNITPQVLSRLGELSSNRGEGQTARKFPGSGQFAPLTPEETAWLIQIMPRIIRQVGIHASGTPPDRLTISVG